MIAADAGELEDQVRTGQEGQEQPEQDIPEQGMEEVELSPEEELQLRVEQLGSELEEMKNQYLRKQADFENFRKRMFREKEEAIKYANSNLLLDLVTIIDDFERAIKSSEESKDFDSFHSGIELIEKQFSGMLEKKYGLKRFDSTGEIFDPERHEALMMEETKEFEPETVVEDFQKGYMLHERILRHSKVKIAKAPAQQGDEA
ncbi:MAG: nucleotide exchange factor GrpE [Spirochaetales bacterium]|nr:nucleotide exchange factor GrpE [Spirochaetales bacterium]